MYSLKLAKVPVTARSDGMALADALSESLPPGSQVVVHWRAPQQGEGSSATTDAPRSLHDKALHAFETPVADGGPDRDLHVVERWTSGTGTEIVLAAHCAASLAPASRKAWFALARRIVDSSLEAQHAQARIASLHKRSSSVKARAFGG